MLSESRLGRESFSRFEINLVKVEQRPDSEVKARSKKGMHVRRAQYQPAAVRLLRRVGIEIETRVPLSRNEVKTNSPEPRS